MLIFCFGGGKADQMTTCDLVSARGEDKCVVGRDFVRKVVRLGLAVVCYYLCWPVGACGRTGERTLV